MEVAATARSFGGEGDDAAMGRGKLAPPNTRGFELMQHPRTPLLGPKQVCARAPFAQPTRVIKLSSVFSQTAEALPIGFRRL